MRPEPGRTLPEPPRRRKDSWEVKLGRALRDQRGTQLSAEDVEVLCWLLDVPPLPITPYMKRVGTIAKIGADEPVRADHLGKLQRGGAVERKHRVIREKMEKERIGKVIERMTRRGLARGRKR